MKKTRQWSRIGLVLVGLVSLLAFSNLQAQLLPVFRIGVLDEENGALAHGAQLAVQEINASGGVVGADGTVFQLQLVIQSPQDMEFAVTNLNQASVIAVIGPPTSEDVLGNRDLLATLNVPILTPATDDTIVANDQTDRILRIRAQESVQGRALADYLINELQAASIETVQLDLESTVGVIGFTRAAAQLGLPPAREFILSDETTLQQITLDVADSAPQFVVAYGPPAETAELYTGLREADWPGIFVYNQANALAFRELVPEGLLEGVISATSWSYTYNDDASQNFIFAYIRAFGELPSPMSAAAYDALYLLEEAIELPGTLINNLLSIRDFSGVQGVLNPAALAAGEISDNVVITELGEFGAPVAVARYAEGAEIPLAEPQFVAATPTPRPTATPDGVFLIITRAVQNVRVGPGLNYDILGQLQEGEQAQVIGATVDFSWVAINFRGTTGWLSRPILDLVGDTTTVPVLTPPPSPTPPPATATPTAPPQPDIVITSATPNRITIGVPFTVTATVRNQGGSAAGQFAVAASFEPGSIFTAFTFNSLAAGAEQTITFTGTLTGPTGPQNVTIVADLNNQVNEGPNGEANNSAFILSYVADAPLLATGTGSGTITLNDLGTVTLDASTTDIQWGGGGIVPLGATRLGVLNGFSSFEQVHRDAIAAATLQNVPIAPVSPGQLIGIQTDGGNKYGVLQIVSATAGGNVTFNYRIYEN
jgi:branched-chain amino acid transport system substrate-binding protein